MSKPNILIQLDTDAHPSVFDAVVAVDSGVTHLLQYRDVKPENVRELVYGAIFTRGVDDLKHTAIFIGGSDVTAGERLLAKVTETFFGPMRVSVLLDSNGANTTAAAAVLAARQHLPPAGATVLVLAGTGPVGRRVAQLLVGENAVVRLASRAMSKAEEVCTQIGGNNGRAYITPYSTGSRDELIAALQGVQCVISAGAPGVLMLPEDVRRGCSGLQVAIDLNAVPALGIAGIAATDKAKTRDGMVCYGALGVGGTKMKIHRAAIAQLFTSNGLTLDAPQILEIGKRLEASA